MRRREFFLIGTLPWAAPASGQAVLPLVVIVTLRDPGLDEESSLPRTATRSLRELGWVEGRTVRLELQTAGGVLSRLRPVVQEVIFRRPSVILAGGGTVTAEVVAATREIPIVMSGSAWDPVERGWAESYARPGGNVTGLTFAADEVIVKQMELLKEVAPYISHVGLLYTQGNAAVEATLLRAKMTAQGLGLRASSAAVDGESSIGAAVQTLRDFGAEALMAIVDPVMDGLRVRLADEANENRMPTVAQLVWYATDGFLLAYAADLTSLHRRSADFADRILRGARAGDLPIERPTKFSLTLNMRTARAIGLNIPSSILARADQVIE